MKVVYRGKPAGQNVRLVDLARLAPLIIGDDLMIDMIICIGVFAAFAAGMVAALEYEDDDE